MRRSIFLALALLPFAVPALAEGLPPAGSLYCHSGGTPMGLFTIKADGTYNWQSVATVDFKTFKDDPSNGDGTMSLGADGTITFTGPFVDEWQVSGTWDVGWLWLANEGGGIMRCGTALGG